MKKVMKKISDYFLILFFILFISLGVYVLIKTPKELTYLENRNLNKFQVFNIKSFLDGSFQDNLENAYLDQFIGSESIKGIMLNKLSLSKKTMNYNKICNNSYVKISGEYYTYDCDQRIINAPYDLKPNTVEYIQKLGEKYSTLHDDVDVYYYYVTTPSNFNLNTNKMEINIPDLVNKYWNNKYHFDYLKINNYEDIKKYFYTSDHHLNHIGSYKMYQDIMKMFNVNDLIKPIDEVTFDFKFTGSSSKASMFYDYDTNFKVYKFDLPKHNTYINGTLSEYGNEENYLNNIYSQSSMTNHYGVFYGGDAAEVLFDFNNSNKDNLLIISNSYSNAVNKLIASHFNKTYDIDLRTYYGAYNEIPDMDKYINEYGVDKVLVIMDYFFLKNDMSISWEEL